MTKTVNMHEAKTQLSKLVREAAAGEEIVIAKAGDPVAKLVAYQKPSGPRKPGGWEGRVWIAPDFDELPPDIAEAFGAGDD
ncbi:MAG TPA: type II toxin-antitoxin system Phd/YefM family antitoxin [Gaiellaceae bacterium]